MSGTAARTAAEALAAQGQAMEDLAGHLDSAPVEMDGDAARAASIALEAQEQAMLDLADLLDAAPPWQAIAQADYDLLDPPDPAVLYVVTDTEPI